MFPPKPNRTPPPRRTWAGETTVSSTALSSHLQQFEMALGLKGIKLFQVERIHTYHNVVTGPLPAGCYTFITATAAIPVPPGAPGYVAAEPLTSYTSCSVVQPNPTTDGSEELEWYPEDLPARLAWDDTLAAVEQIGDGWRVPSTDEWSSEIDRTKFNPALRDPSKFPGIKNEGYWTSTPGASDPKTYAWIVGLYYGLVGLRSQNDEFWVRPCRARRAPSQ